jgi:SAM-dependent methyltransferase
MSNALPDWQLPPGVTRGLWDYLHDAELARNYDASLAGSALMRADLAFAERHFERPGRLLDLGCGTGRLLVPFAKRGYWVLGIDLHEEMLRQAAANAHRAGVSVHLLKANLVMLGALKSASFDYAACLFSTLGMIDGTDNRQRLLNHAYRLLRPGGKFVLHVHNRWFNMWNPAGRRWLARDLIRLGFPGRERGDMTMPVHQGVAGLKLHLFTCREVRRMLGKAGFDVVETMSLGLTGRLRKQWFLKGMRSYGFLLCGQRPAAE